MDSADEKSTQKIIPNKGEKISKSKGTCLTARELLNCYDVDFLRFYFAKNINDKKSEFSFKSVNMIATETVIKNWLFGCDYGRNMIRFQKSTRGYFYEIRIF